jgi:hypothetical protein
MRAPKEAVPELGAAVRPIRLLVAAIVVLASAATGYVGSRIWPLPTDPGSIMNLTAADNSSPEPELREGSPLPASPVSKSAVATEPRAPFADPSQSVIAGAARLRETARAQVEGSSTGSPDSPVAVLYRSPTEQARADDVGPPATSTGSGRRSERTATPRRWAPGAKISRGVRGQSTKGAGPALVEFAPNPKPNQASRDFMARPSSY